MPVTLRQICYNDLRNHFVDSDPVINAIRRHGLSKPELIDVVESHGRLEIWTWHRTEHKRIFPPLDATVWQRLGMQAYYAGVVPETVVEPQGLCWRCQKPVDKGIYCRECDPTSAG